MSWWLPPTCVFCGARGRHTEEGEPFDLCADCEAWLPKRTGPAPPDPHWWVPFDYAPPVDHAIRQLKFHGEIACARVLGQLMARYRASAREAAPFPELLVPVPLHDRRLAERGYNQAALIAHYASQGLGVRVEPRALERVIETKEQSHLEAAERLVNVRGAFQVARASLVRGRRLALIDDVVTTGSTAREARAALLAGGAASVEVWAAAGSARR